MSASIAAELGIFERLSHWFGALFTFEPRRRVTVETAKPERRPLSRAQPDIIAILSRYHAAQQAQAAEMVARAALASFELPSGDEEQETVAPSGRRATLAQRMATVASVNRPLSCERARRLNLSNSAKPKRCAEPRQVARSKAVAGIAASSVARPAVHEPHAKPAAASAIVIDLGAERRARRTIARAA